MTVRQKVVPPVTPRIVQARPRQRAFRYLFLFCAFLLTAWLSFDYGRTGAPVNLTTETPVIQSHEAEQRIAELTQERDALKQKVAELEDSVHRANQALVEAHARSQAPQRAESSPREIPAPITEPTPEPATAEPETVDNTLKLANVRIVPTESADVFKIIFSVRRDGNGGGRVTGTIWIAVNGFSEGEPRRLSFKTLSPDRRLYVKMGFDQQQDVTEDVVLPADFRPKNILIEAKPYGDKYTGTSMKLDWDTNR